MNFSQANILLKQLIHFGLNPQEWSLSRISKNKYLIQNTVDKSYSYLGHTQEKNDKSEWQELTLLSI